MTVSHLVRQGLLVVMLLLCYIITVPVKADSQDSGQTAASLDSTARPQDQATLLALQGQRVELLERHNEQLLDSVNKSVYGLVTLVVGGLLLFGAVIGINWFQFNKRYKDDKAELSKHFSDELAKVRGELDGSVETAVVDLRKVARESAQSVKSLLQSQIDRIDLKSVIEELKSEAEDEHTSDYGLFLAAQALKLTHSAWEGEYNRNRIYGLIRNILEKLSSSSIARHPENFESIYGELERLDGLEVDALKKKLSEMRDE